MNGWFCSFCLEDFEGNPFDRWDREKNQVLCDKCKSKKEVENNERP